MSCLGNFIYVEKFALTVLAVPPYTRTHTHFLPFLTHSLTLCLSLLLEFELLNIETLWVALVLRGTWYIYELTLRFTY